MIEINAKLRRCHRKKYTTFIKQPYKHYHKTIHQLLGSLIYPAYATNSKHKEEIWTHNNEPVSRNQKKRPKKKNQYMLAPTGDGSDIDNEKV